MRTWGGAFRSIERLAAPGERRLVRSGDGVGPSPLRGLKQRPGRRAGWSSLQPPTGRGTRRSMARPAVCALALAAVLLLGVATVSRSKGLRGKEHQGTPRIPSQFSQEECVAMKEALKSEPGPPSARLCSDTGSLLGPPCGSPVPPQRVRYSHSKTPAHLRPAASAHLVPRPGDATLPPDWLLGTLLFPA